MSLGRQVDARWLDWDGDAWVGVAIRLDEPLGSGKVYTFLPMEEPSPLAAHVHAPFFTKLARREFGLDVPLNSYLMGEIAATCLGLLRVLSDAGDHATVAPLVVDLAAWRPPHHDSSSKRVPTLAPPWRRRSLCPWQARPSGRVSKTHSYGRRS